MKSVRVVMFVSLILVNVFACGSGKYKDAEKAFEDLTDLTKKCTAALKKADNPQKVVALVNKYLARAKPILHRLRKLDKKYGNIKKMPGGLRSRVDDWAQAYFRMGLVGMELYQRYYSNSKVKSAIRKLTKEMKI